MKKLMMLLALFVSIISTQTSAEASEAERYGDVYYKIVTLANGKKEVHIVGATYSSQHIVIPEKIKTYPVTEIADSAFLTEYGYYWEETDNSAEDNAAYQATKIKHVTLPNTLKRIGNSAFEGNKLTEITLPNSVVEIGASAFKGNQLTTVKLSTRLVKIGGAAFSDNKLTNLTLPSSVKSIGREAFARNRLTTITLPNSVTLIHGNIAIDNPITNAKLSTHLQIKKDKQHGDLYYTVVKNNGKTEIKITGYNVQAKKKKLAVPATINKIPVTEIGSFAFAPHITPIGTGRVDVSKFTLKEVTLPSSIRKIGVSAFEGTGILLPKLPTNLVEIGDFAFDQSGAVVAGTAKDLTIPSKVKTIGAYAFAGNQLKGALTIPKAVTALGEGAFSHNVFSKAVIHASIEEIAPYTFAYNKISNLTLPKNVTTIDTYAFTYNALPRLVLPATMMVVGEGAFSYNNIQSVELRENVTTVLDGAFYGNKIAHITLPASVQTFAFSAVENMNQVEHNKLKSITLKGSKTIIYQSQRSDVYTDKAKTKLFTNWGNVQQTPITLYIN